MFATVGRVQVQPGKQEEGRSAWRQTILPVLQQQQGFRGAVVLHDPQNNKGMAVMLWDSPADAEAGLNSSAVQQAFEERSALLVGQPELESYNVLLSELD